MQRSRRSRSCKRLYEAEDEVKNLIDLARSLEGLTRNAGMHAGGVVIAPVRAHRLHAAVLREKVAAR